MTREGAAIAKRWGLIACLALAPAMALAGGAWRIGADQLRYAMMSFAAAAPDDVSVSYRVGSIRGFPFALRAPLRDVNIAHSQGGSYHADHLEVVAPLWRPRSLYFRPITEQFLNIGRHGFSVTFDEARLTQMRRCGSMPCIQATIARIRMTSPLILPVDGVTAAHARVSIAHEIIDGNIEIDFEIENLSAGAAFPALIERIAGEGSISRSSAFTPFGVISLQRFEILAGEARLAASGILGLDASGFLEGNVSLALNKPLDIAARMRQSGVFKASDVETASAVLASAALALRGRAELPVTFSEGAVYVDGRPIAQTSCFVCGAPARP